MRLVIGTRPEAIKLAPVARALAERGARPTLIYTGQHAALRAEEFGLDGFRSIELHCPGLPDPDQHVRRVASEIQAHVESSTDLVIVQGDTSSALGGALGAAIADVPIAHVEAGLRSHDPNMPWPEEGYRVAIDSRADLLFAPTDVSAKNLAAERIGGEIFVTGNTSIDALHALLPVLPAPQRRASTPHRLLVTCHRRENWGEPLLAIARGLRRLANCDGVLIDVITPPNQHVALTLRRHFRGVPTVRLMGPCPQREMIARMLSADIVLSDSGGLQEEAAALGVPLLILRDVTERPEGLATGNLRIVGTNEARIVATVRALLSNPAALGAMRHPSTVYGDGRAAQRIAECIAQWIAARRTPATAA